MTVQRGLFAVMEVNELVEEFIVIEPRMLYDFLRTLLSVSVLSLPNDNLFALHVNNVMTNHGIISSRLGLQHYCPWVPEIFPELPE